MFASLKSLLAGTGDPNFPFVAGDIEEGPNENRFWTMRRGTRKPDGKDVTIFELDKKTASDEQIKAAQHAVKRLKTVRHPNVLTYLGASETEVAVLLATEAVVPLSKVLEQEDNEQGKSWGLYQILSAIAFFSDSKLVHRNLCMDSVFVNEEGDWKLAGFERLAPSGTNLEDLPLPVAQQFKCPEDLRGQSNRGHPWSADMWGFGCLIWEVHNGPLKEATELKNVDAIPQSLIPHYISLVSANPRQRPKPSILLSKARKPGSYFKNDFVDTNLFLGELAVKDKEEVQSFYQRLPDMIDSFPPSLCKTKLLPQLLQAFQYGGAGYQVLAPMLKIGKMLDAEEYQKRIVPSLVKLFSSSDRATRISLLKKLPDFAEYLTDKVVSNDIFPPVAGGFSDTIPAVREETVKSMLLLAPKLSQSLLDGPLMKHFAKLQTDEKPSIRTNTTICLGKIACHLSPTTRAKVLVPAFLRALRDPFVHTRTAGAMALLATMEYYAPKVCAARILPVVSPLAVDPASSVRTQVLRLLRAIVDRLEENSRALAEEERKQQEQQQQEQQQQGGPSLGASVGGGSSDASGVSTRLLGWASTTMGGIASKALTRKAAAAEGMPAASPGAGKAHPQQQQQSQALEREADEENDDDNDEWHDCLEPPSRLDVLPAVGEEQGSDGWGGDDDDDAAWSDIDSNAGDGNEGFGSTTLGGATAQAADSADGWGSDDDGWGDMDDEDLDLGDADAGAEEKSAAVSSTPSVTSSTSGLSAEEKRRQRRAQAEERARERERRRQERLQAKETKQKQQQGQQQQPVGGGGSGKAKLGGGGGGGMKLTRKKKGLGAVKKLD